MLKFSQGNNYAVNDREQVRERLIEARDDARGLADAATMVGCIEQRLGQMYGYIATQCDAISRACAIYSERSQVVAAFSLFAFNLGLKAQEQERRAVHIQRGAEGIHTFGVREAQIDQALADLVVPPGKPRT